MRSYVLGHLAGVAADVVLQRLSTPGRGPATTAPISIVSGSSSTLWAAHGFFQRDDLHRGQSWEDYFLSSGDLSARAKN
jgi:hypothetical protein